MMICLSQRQQQPHFHSVTSSVPQQQLQLQLQLQLQQHLVGVTSSCCHRVYCPVYHVRLKLYLEPTSEVLAVETSPLSIVDV